MYNHENDIKLILGEFQQKKYNFYGVVIPFLL